MSIVFLISIFIAFGLFLLTNKIMALFPNISLEILVNFIKNDENIQNKAILLNKTVNIIAYCITFVLSFSFFMIINKFIREIFNKCELLKKQILKESYINGTWVGWYIGYSNQKRYYVERIYQTIDGVFIKGITYDASSLKENSKWNSTSLEIDSEKKCYFFSYDSQSSSGKENCNGCGKMDFHYNKKKYPSEMSGYTLDIQLADKGRIISKEIKISNNANEYDNDYCVKKAIEKFKNS